jgi:Ca2+-binding RTX toxin-like protein
VEITTNGTKATTTLTGVTGRVVAYGLGGNDTITVNANRSAELHGGTGNDTITGAGVHVARLDA